MDVLRGGARAIVLLACALVFSARAQVASESAIKAAYLYKFAAYVEWPAPARPDAPFVIATLAADDVATELARILPGRAIAGRPAVVRRVSAGESLKDVQILFVGRTAGDQRAAVEAARREGALTVTDSSLDHGAAINFVVADDRVAFEVSLEAAERSGLRISSRMLSVARRVVQRGPT
jgi:hypothetical protein